MEIKLEAHVIMRSRTTRPAWDNQGHVLGEYGCWISTIPKRCDIGDYLKWLYTVDVDVERYYIEGGCTRKFQQYIMTWW